MSFHSIQRVNKLLGVLLVIFVASPSTGQAAEDMCRILRKIEAAAIDGLQDLRGEDLGNEGWMSTLHLPGFNFCFIGLFEGKYAQICVLEILASEEDALRQHEGLAKNAWNCLGQNWVVTEVAIPGQRHKAIHLVSRTDPISVGFTIREESQESPLRSESLWSIELMLIDRK